MLHSVTRRVGSLLVAALVFAAAGCSDQSRSPLGLDAQFSTLTGPVLVVRTTPAIEETVALVIDSRGGELKSSEHMLVVPRGAVDSPTLFTMKVSSGMHVRVDLSAVRVADGVRVSQFPEAVKLRLSYRNVLRPDEDRLVVTYLQDGSVLGRKTRVGSERDKGNMFVDGMLFHFSAYAMAVD
jgi:hypothetical protein